MTSRSDLPWYAWVLLVVGLLVVRGAVCNSPAGSGGDEPDEARGALAPRRDSTLEARAMEVRALLEAERYDEAAASAWGEDDDEAPATETLRSLAERADELGLYARARAIPASDLDGNALAYRDLAARYPSNPTYRERATRYETRAREAKEAAARAAERAAARERPRSLYGSGTGSVGCCRRCSRGKPCGNSCIARHLTCHRGAGCAC